MLLISAWVDAIIDAILADTDWLAHETAAVSDVGLVPVIAAFTPSPSLALGGLVFPASSVFLDGRVKKMGDPTAQRVISATGRPGIKMVEPIGGFTWTVDNLDDGPVTVYGFALVRAPGDTPSALYATAVLPIPQTFNSIGLTLQASSILGYFEQQFFEALTEAFSTGFDEVAP